MQFVHTHYEPNATIAAVATPPGEGGVAIVRISGKEALDVADKIFSGNIKSYKSHTAHFGHVKTLDGKHVDDALVLVMLGKRSYTGEDTVEIHCHGGSLITKAVLECALSAGARAALPGEFTFKAFINGKIDLAQAEAVQELIGAKNERAMQAAESQLKGALTEKIRKFQHSLTDVAAILEAWVDFPEEGLEFASQEEMISTLEQVLTEIQKLKNTFHDGKILSTGVSLCLAGAPNVGKSSLMNTLLSKDRAIVTPIAGTTRDLVEDHLSLGGLNFRLTDTAGIREVEEIVEKEGIKRSKEAIKEADLILFVLDATCGLTKEDQVLLKELPLSKTLVVWNKIDLPHPPLVELNAPHVVCLSAKEKIGIEELKKEIDSIIWKLGPPDKQEVMITNLRHKNALDEAIDLLGQVIEGLKTDLSPEWITQDMRQALNALGKVIGTDIGEDILSAIFSKFCIGK